MILSMLFIGTFLSIQEPLELRDSFEKSHHDSGVAKELIEELEAKSDLEPVEVGYLGALEMQMANHSFSPFSKWNHFVKGKTYLAKAVHLSSEDVEIRYLRLINQAEAPRFLGYRMNVDEDLEFILSSLTVLEDLDLKERILKYLIGSDLLTEIEKEELNE